MAAQAVLSRWRKGILKECLNSGRAAAVDCMDRSAQFHPFHIQFPKR